MHSIFLLCVLSTDWWNNYGDPELNRIVNRALENNLDLQTATQRIAEARALSLGARSKLTPSIDATSSAQRLRGGFAQNIIRIPNASGARQGGSFVSPFETGLLQGGLDMKWELDLFGSNRAGLEGSRADVLAEEESRKDLSITVAGEVARAYMEMRGTTDRMRILRDTLRTQRELLSLIEDRVQAGLSSQFDIERQRSLIANTEAMAAGLEAERTQFQNRLAVLVGDEAFVDSLATEGTVPLEAPGLNPNLPSELLKRRPDVRAAEARLAAAMARWKQARTDLYPKISLTGLVGRQGTSLSTLSLGGGNFFNIGPQLQLPIFNGGRIRSNIAANDARVEQAKIAYRNEILTAFEEAANAIAALSRQRERESKLAEASGAARTALELSADLQRAGVNDFLTVLDAERSLLDADYQRSIAHTEVLVQSVALYKALAGGWPN